MLQFFYACYFAAVGVSVPFFSPYLRALGLSGWEVSLMMSAAPVCHLGVPLLWGWLADRTRRVDVVLRIACVGAAVCLVPIVGLRTMPAMLWVYSAHQLFAVAILGLADSLALDRVRRLGGDYGRIRLWGSASFIAACWVAGPWLERRGRGDGDPLVPLLMVGAFLLTAVAALALRGQPTRARPHAEDVRRLLGDPRFRFLLVVAPLHWASLAPYHAFFGVLARERGASPTTLSHAFVVSVAAELAVFFSFRRLRRRFSLGTLLTLAMGATALRWALTAACTSTLALVLLQAAHALTFGVFWAAAMGWLAACVPEGLRATGQTLYTAATFGVGNLIGMLGAGRLYDATGGAATSFGAAAALELCPFALTLIAARRLSPGEPGQGVSPPAAAPAPAGDS